MAAVRRRDPPGAVRLGRGDGPAAHAEDDRRRPREPLRDLSWAGCQRRQPRVHRLAVGSDRRHRRPGSQTPTPAVRPVVDRNPRARRRPGAGKVRRPSNDHHLPEPGATVRDALGGADLLLRPRGLAHPLPRSSRGRTRGRAGAEGIEQTRQRAVALGGGPRRRLEAFAATLAGPRAHARHRRHTLVAQLPAAHLRGAAMDHRPPGPANPGRGRPVPSGPESGDTASEGGTAIHAGVVHGRRLLQQLSRPFVRRGARLPAHVRDQPGQVPRTIVRSRRPPPRCRNGASARWSGSAAPR